MSKKAKKGLEIGSFVVTRDTGTEHDWVCIRAIVGNWTLRYRDDSALYGKILEMARNKEYHDLLRYFINMNFMLANTLPDAQFVKDFFVAFNDYTKRMVDAMKDPSRDEQDRHAEEAEALVGLQSEISEIIQESMDKTVDIIVDGDAKE